MATTLLIKAIDITKGTPISGNLDVNKYLPVIKEVQVFVIEKLLGTKLYKKLLVDYAANTVTGDYLILLESYIQPIIIHATAAEYIVQGSYNIANGGIFKHLPENAETVSKSEISFLAQHHRDKSDAYVERLQIFLCDTNLPEYKNAQLNQYDIQPDSSFTFTGGWDLSDRKVRISGKNIYGF